MQLEKELIPFDDADCYLIVGFKHSEREEAKKFEEEVTGEKVDSEDYQPVMVRKIGDFYDWSGNDECKSCHRPLQEEKFEAFLVRF